MILFAKNGDARNRGNGPGVNFHRSASTRTFNNAKPTLRAPFGATPPFTI
jgi:hypothetical protein